MMGCVFVSSTQLHTGTWSIYRDVYKLEPGRIIEIDGINPKHWKECVYWSAPNCIYRAREDPSKVLLKMLRTS